MMPWVFDDGGRKAAGFQGEARDCVVRAAAIATGRPYTEIHAIVKIVSFQGRGGKRRAPRPRGAGVPKRATKMIMQRLGFLWVPLMGIGTGCRVHLRPGELPAHSPLVLQLSRHLTAVIDGVVHDTHDPSRSGRRCVYGYWYLPRTG